MQLFQRSLFQVCYSRKNYEYLNIGLFMISLTEIETAIQQLPENDIRQLSGWIQSYIDEMWDRQIETDLGAGKLDSLIARAEADISANRVKHLDEVINNT
jgi:hypothetical protein